MHILMNSGLICEILIRKNLQETVNPLQQVILFDGNFLRKQKLGLWLKNSNPIMCSQVWHYQRLMNLATSGIIVSQTHHLAINVYLVSCSVILVLQTWSLVSSQRLYQNLQHCGFQSVQNSNSQIWENEENPFRIHTKKIS